MRPGSAAVNSAPRTVRSVNLRHRNAVVAPGPGVDLLNLTQDMSEPMNNSMLFSPDKQTPASKSGNFSLTLKMLSNQRVSLRN